MGEPWPIGGLAALKRDVAAPDASAAPAAPTSDPAAEALMLYAKVLGAATLESACHALVGALASQLHCNRVTLGWIERSGMVIAASSQLDLGQDNAELPQRLLGAMNEAADQGVTLSWPGADGGDWVRVEQQALQRHVGGGVTSLPLGLQGEPFGALCLERHDGGALGPADTARLEQIMTLALPALRWMQVGAMPWHRRMRRDLRQGLAALRQPQRRTLRRMMIGGACVLAFVALAPLEHEVGGRARIEGATQRVLAAPTDGFVKTAHVRPGDRVKAGAPLVDLLEQDLRLERERWSSQFAQHENAYAAALARSDRVGAATSMERVAEAQAELALLDQQLLRGRIVAPFDALVVQGDLSQSIGTPVRQGDTLLTLATTDRYRVIVEVDEVDIARVQSGQTGSLTLSSMPWGGEALTVERIVPIAKAVDGRNVFEVEASLAAPADALRPGLLGRAELVVGRQPPLWVWIGRAVDRIRVSLWSWFG